ncbi:unnamed protein product [Cladocopium goreaui]|uniref:Uncharacterized protein n=1 Tax=Cladocopium goreaui TaxID=2562237 RepID=A0A9P1DXG5_9DINO|nr:unnamed protein product [Cladocopium goreaui]
MDDLPLKCSWVVWQQRAAPKSTSGTSSSHYEESTTQIASISSVEEFWQTWERLPQPSDLLTRRMAEKNLDGSEDCHYVDALMIFREGVLPQWEDAANSEGGHFQFHFKTSTGAAQLDEYWNNVVLGTLGNTLEPDMITGLRLVDKITGPKGGVPSTLRIEASWCGLAVLKIRRRTGAVAALQRNIESCLATRTLEGRLGHVPKVGGLHLLDGESQKVDRRRFLGEGRAEEPQDDAAPMALPLDRDTSENTLDPTEVLGFAALLEVSGNSVYISKLCKGRTCNDATFPILDYDPAQKKCVCLRHPCWDDNGVQHKCPGDVPEDKYLSFYHDSQGKLNCGCSKEPNYKSVYLSKDLCKDSHCTPEHPILDYDEEKQTCICRTHPCWDDNGLTHSCPDAKFPILRFRYDEDLETKENKNVCECIAPMHPPRDEL